jgi:hypothetical protein
VQRAAAQRRVITDQAGAVMLEFLLAFPPLFVLFLGLCQLVLLAVADLVVRHAAIAGVRAAAVVLDDDPRHYDGAPRGWIGEDSSTSPLDQAVASQIAARGPAPPAHDVGSHASRMAAIRMAVHAPLAAIAPATTLLIEPGAGAVARALGDGASRAVAGLTWFIPMATAIVFPVAAGHDELQEAEVASDPVVLRVTHLAPCAVPIARTLLCERLEWDARGRRLGIRGADDAARRALRELQRAPLAAGQIALVAAGIPVSVVVAEASLPVQAAPYAYASEAEP